MPLAFPGNLSTVTRVEEELLEHSPPVHVRRPRLDYESHAIGPDRNEVGSPLVAAGRIVRRVARRAGVDKPIGPHTLRHAFITAALDAESHCVRSRKPRRTPTRARLCAASCRVSLDRHATYIVAAYLAGAAR